MLLDFLPSGVSSVSAMLKSNPKFFLEHLSARILSQLYPHHFPLHPFPHHFSSTPFLLHLFFIFLLLLPFISNTQQSKYIDQQTHWIYRSSAQQQPHYTGLQESKLLASSGICLAEYLGIKSYLIFKAPPPSAGAMHPNKEVVRQKHQEACTDVQGAPGQTQAKKGHLQRVEARPGSLGGIQKN